MNLRHAAALALVGWYLMVPPAMGPPKNWSNPVPPMARWVVAGEFDSPAPCKLARDKMSNTAHQQFQDLRHEFLHGRQDSGELIDEFYEKYSRQLDLLAGKLDAQCIATDDPLLKEK
jgi:hypothetical protein